MFVRKRNPLIPTPEHNLEGCSAKGGPTETNEVATPGAFQSEYQLCGLFLRLPPGIKLSSRTSTAGLATALPGSATLRETRLPLGLQQPLPQGPQPLCVPRVRSRGSRAGGRAIEAFRLADVRVFTGPAWENPSGGSGAN